MQGRPEVGVSIQVGISTQVEGDAKDAPEAADFGEDDGNLMGGGIMIEAPFDGDEFGDY